MKIKKRQFTKVEKCGNRYNAAFFVDNQRFWIVYNTTRKEAEWFCDMFDKALKKVVKNISK